MSVESPILTWLLLLLYLFLNIKGDSGRHESYLGNSYHSSTGCTPGGSPTPDSCSTIGYDHG
jgi:hypothetical protein